MSSTAACAICGRSSSTASISFELDAIAADLDLGVDAAAILDLAVLVDAAKVAGAVDAARGVVLDVEEIANELLHGQFVAIDVANRQPDARDADFAELAGRERPCPRPDRG